MYAKVFDIILDSSIWEEPHATIRVWLTMLCMSDEGGVIRAVDSAIRKRAGGSKEKAKITDEEWSEALQTLQDPDLESKDQDYGGRRIERIEGGWLVLNKRKYRDIRTKKQLQDAERQRRKYWKDRETSRTSRDITTNASVSVSELDGSSEGEIGGSGGKEGMGPPASHSLVPTSGRETGTWIQEVLGEIQPQWFEEDRLLWESRTVFAYWMWRAKKNGSRTILTDDRKSRLKRYLRIYGLEDCLLAVEGAWHHPDHNQRDGRSYHELENIFKLKEGSGTVEKLADAGRRKRSAVDKVLARLTEQGYNPGVEDG